MNERTDIAMCLMVEIGSFYADLNNGPLFARIGVKALGQAHLIT
ncbi:hypothetical protein [Paenibacillus allorhizoplanae]|nr:hypothetical protein [Paenibacillus allorhizoplanae]